MIRHLFYLIMIRYLFVWNTLAVSLVLHMPHFYLIAISEIRGDPGTHVLKLHCQFLLSERQLCYLPVPVLIGSGLNGFYICTCSRPRYVRPSLVCMLSCHLGSVMFLQEDRLWRNTKINRQVTYICHVFHYWTGHLEAEWRLFSPITYFWTYSLRSYTFIRLNTKTSESDNKLNFFELFWPVRGYFTW